jgi:serine/threonine protein kinase
VPQAWCPSCQQFFPDGGFCPFDGTQLQGPPDHVDTRPQAVRSVSAHDDVAAAMAAYQAPPAEYDRLIGQVLDGRYRIERKIGEGGMGVVFAARHAVIERPLAIKVLKRDVARDMATIKRFVQEAKAASRIGHPNIVDVTDFGNTPDGMTYSVMEYIDGQTLSHAIRKSGPMPAARALPIAAQIARALGAAHAKGIVHRDLKPENVFLLDRDGRRDFVKIVDFGIAKVVPVDPQSPQSPAAPRLTRAGAVFGTPEYMAPEQAAGKSDTDGRVDIYALGIILHEMLVGRVPHKGDTVVRTLAMQMLDPIEPPSRAHPELAISGALEAVLMKALAKRREQRYATMEELLADLGGSAGDISLAQPVSISVTAGGEAMSLATLPPGADRSSERSPHLAGDRTPPPGPLPRPPTGPGEVSTGKRMRSEPAFVGSDRPVTFEHAFDGGTGGALPAPPRRRWPVALLAIAGLGVAGAVAAVLTIEPGARPPVVAAVTDAAVVVEAADAAAVDAAVVVELPALPVDPVDGGRAIAVRPERRSDGGVARATLTPRGTVAIQIVTKPEGAAIYLGNSYRGASGTTIEETPGTRAMITCTLPGYQPGKVEVLFDGDQEVVLCRMSRIKRCIDGLKNPFDDCPE